MTTERWTRVKAVFSEAMDLPPAERPAFVDHICGSDVALREEVASLLAASEGGDSLPDARDAIASAARAVASDRDIALRSVLEGALGRQYDIVRPLGRGGMGNVYLARERALERFVAIKVLRPDLAIASESRERFRREARIAAQLSHPGIMRLHTFGEVGGVWYFVMEYVHGETLAERLRLESRLPWRDALQIFIALVDALECAHRNGVIHRDIKPANILLDDETGRTVLADFGISKTTGVGDSLTASGAVVGTPDYMSPEQALGWSDVDERSDLYSLGAVAYTMLAGQGPFATGVTQEFPHRWLLQDPAPLQSIAPTVPETLAAIVMKCLARDRAARWPNAHSLKQALAYERENSLETLPEDLRDLPSFAPYALLWAVGWSAIAILTLRSASERALLLLIALLVPVGLVLHVWNTGWHELGPAQLARVAWWPPQWWGMWWPRALRRPSDLWARLPWRARVVRAALSAFFITIPALIALRQWFAARGRLAPGADEWFVLGELGIAVAAATIVAGALGWARHNGLTLVESACLLFGPTVASSSWSAANIARLLVPETGRVRPPDRDAPADYRRAISDLLLLLPAGSKELASSATAAADCLLHAIDRLNAESASLARDGSAADADRLSTQLAALGDGSSAESPERHELRELVRRQLEVVRRIRARHELVAQQRAHFFDMLRGLWTQLCAACDSAGDERTDVVSRKVRALCQEIVGEIESPPVGPPAVGALSA